MNKMQFACFSLVGFIFLTSLTGCGATAPNRTASLNDVYSGQAQNLYGKLRIAFSAADYSTQATTSEVNSLKVTVSGEKLAAPVIKTVAREAASAVEFPGLPVGSIVLKVQALSAAGVELGVVNQADIAVQGGKTTTVSLKLKLNPTVVAPTDGGLSVGVVIEDGDTVSAPTPAPSSTPAPAAAFSDSFEAGIGNWETSFSTGTPVSTWTASTVAASAGTHCATAGDATSAVTTQGTYTLTLKNGIDLSSSSAPSLTFKLNNFVPRHYFRNAYLTIEASSDGSWKKVGEVTDATSAWTPITISLASVKGRSVKVRFNFTYQSIVTTGSHSAAQIDEVTIK
ncbi:MAG TPA: hypothetical protein V6C82_09570 [Chroococcales cyanobacterium]|jgi:hypothetical protein